MVLHRCLGEKYPGGDLPVVGQTFTKQSKQCSLSIRSIPTDGWLARRDDQTIAARRRGAEIAARADRQHRAGLVGDELVGVYGDWPPAVKRAAGRAGGQF